MLYLPGLDTVFDYISHFDLVWLRINPIAAGPRLGDVDAGLYWLYVVFKISLSRQYTWSDRQNKI